MNENQAKKVSHNAWVTVPQATNNLCDKHGWIKLHRSITEHWIWQDSVKLKWWLDILLVANHTSVKVNIGMKLYVCHRGQTIMSLSNWAKRWGVSRDTARNFFVLLEKDKMILHEKIGKSTRITICNYDTYQDSTQNVHESYTNNTHISDCYSETCVDDLHNSQSDCYSETCVDDLHNSQTQNKHKPNANRPMSATNNNDKKEKNENNIESIKIDSSENSFSGDFKEIDFGIGESQKHVKL